MIISSSDNASSFLSATELLYLIRNDKAPPEKTRKNPRIPKNPPDKTSGKPALLKIPGDGLPKMPGRLQTVALPKAEKQCKQPGTSDRAGAGSNDSGKRRTYRTV